MDFRMNPFPKLLFILLNPVKDGNGVDFIQTNLIKHTNYKVILIKNQWLKRAKDVSFQLKNHSCFRLGDLSPSLSKAAKALCPTWSSWFRHINSGTKPLTHLKTNCHWFNEGKKLWKLATLCIRTAAFSLTPILFHNLTSLTYFVSSLGKQQQHCGVLLKREKPCLSWWGLGQRKWLLTSLVFSHLGNAKRGITQRSAALLEDMHFA